MTVAIYWSDIKRIACSTYKSAWLGDFVLSNSSKPRVCFFGPFCKRWRRGPANYFWSWFLPWSTAVVFILSRRQRVMTLKTATPDKKTWLARQQQTFSNSSRRDFFVQILSYRRQWYMSQVVAPCSDGWGIRQADIWCCVCSWATVIGTMNAVTMVLYFDWPYLWLIQHCCVIVWYEFEYMLCPWMTLCSGLLGSDDTGCRRHFRDQACWLRRPPNANLSRQVTFRSSVSFALVALFSYFVLLFCPIRHEVPNFNQLILTCLPSIINTSLCSASDIKVSLALLLQLLSSFTVGYQALDSKLLFWTLL